MTQPSIYAIDFGTSNSLLAAANAEQIFPPVAIDEYASDPTVLRSILYHSPSGQVSFGAEALKHYVDNGMDGRLLRSLKRFLPAADFRSTYIGNRRYRLEELIGSILRVMRERANAHFDCDVRRVLLGRPARYAKKTDHDSLAQERMREAARLAGFEQVEFCAEPTAAARDFAADLTEPRTVLIADLGGGTSDFSVVRLQERHFSTRDVLAIGGVSLAGDALDGALMKRELGRHFGSEAQYRLPFGSNLLPMPAIIIDMLSTPAKLPLLAAPQILRMLRDVRAGCSDVEQRQAVERLICVVDDALGFDVFEAVEATKCALSQASHAAFRFAYPGIDVEETVSRARFEQACQGVVRRVSACLEATLNESGLRDGDVDLVCMTGGTSRVPSVERMLVDRFGAGRLRRLQGLHSVVGGLAHQARALATG